MSRTLKLFPLLFCLFAISAKAERWDSFGPAGVTLRTGFNLSNLQLWLEDVDRVAQRVQYTPNSNTNLLLSAALDTFSVVAAVPLPDLVNRRNGKGETQAQDFQARLHFEKFSLELFYQNYLGYYIENSGSFTGQKTDQGYMLAPDLRSEHIGTNFVWNFNSADFSMAAAFDQTQRQTSSSWSWLGGLGFHSYRFSSPDSLVPDSETDSYGGFGDVRAVRVRSIQAGLGAGGTWVFADKSFLSGSLMYYAGQEEQKMEKMGHSSYGSGVTSVFALKSAVGYNGDRFLVAMTVIGDSNKSKVENAEVSFNTISVGMMFGTHYDLWDLL